MKLVLITDTHAGARGDSIIFNNYFLRFYTEILFPYLDKHNIDTIIHLGDVFDRRKYINFLTLHSWRENVFEVLDRKYKTTIIQGNHDLYHKDNNVVNSLDEVLRPYKNINIIRDPHEVEYAGTEILMIPWMHKANEELCAQKLANTKAQIVFGHFDIIGFQMYKGLVNHDYGLKQDQFNRFDLVLSGHYHHKSTNSNIHYLGSPYEMVWSDYNDPRGFHIFDTDTRELEFIKNPLHIFRKIMYNDVDKKYEDFVCNKEVVRKDDNGNDIKLEVSNLAKYKDCYVKIVIEQKTNQYLFDQFLEALYRENPADVTIVEAVVDADLNTDVIDETKDTLTLLVEYVDNLGIIEENKKPLVDLLKSLYMESQNIDV